MKNSRKSRRALWAALLGAALLVGLATAVATPQIAEAAPTPFTCAQDFYQVVSGQMYQYDLATNTFAEMTGSSFLSGLNGIGYNPADGYIYGIAGGNLYRIASDGSHSAAIPLTGVTPSFTGGDFIAPNELLTVSVGGVWTEVNTSTDVVSSFSSSGKSWTPSDFAYDSATGTGYGMKGTTLFVATVSGTSVSVATHPVTGSLASNADDWGSDFIDSAGNVYLFDNSTFDLVEISAANLASTTPAATYLTTANTLTGNIDGASCPTASSPLAPTVTTVAATSVTSTSAVLGGTVATGIPTGSDVPDGDILICYSTSSTLVSGALSVSPVCAATSPSSLALDTTATAVSLSVSGLSSATTYYFQLAATNSDGVEAFGDVVTLTTLAEVTFDPNGGTGTMIGEQGNAPTALTDNTFRRAGYTFNGWNTAADGSGAQYADAASYPFSTNVTLYAQWAKVTLPITGVDPTFAFDLALLLVVAGLALVASATVIGRKRGTPTLRRTNEPA